MDLNPDRTPRGCHHGCLVLQEKRTGRSIGRIHFDGRILTRQAITDREARSYNLIERRDRATGARSHRPRGQRKRLPPPAVSILAFKDQIGFSAAERRMVFPPQYALGRASFALPCNTLVLPSAQDESYDIMAGLDLAIEAPKTRVWMA